MAEDRPTTPDAPRRIVTGLGPDGRSRITHDDAAATLIWANDAAPADNARDLPADAAMALALPPGAAQFIWSDLPPGASAPIHATDTVDYVVVVSGAATVVTEEGEAALSAGDVLVQRGVLHGWRNDGAEPCRMISVMLPAHPIGAGADLSRLGL